MNFLINLAISILKHAEKTGKMTNDQINEILNIIGPDPTITIDDTEIITDAFIDKVIENLYDRLLIDESDESLSEISYELFQNLASTDPLFANMRYDVFFNIFGPTITKLYNTFRGQ